MRVFFRMHIYTSNANRVTNVRGAEDTHVVMMGAQRASDARLRSKPTENMLQTALADLLCAAYLLIQRIWMFGTCVKTKLMVSKNSQAQQRTISNIPRI